MDMDTTTTRTTLPLTDMQTDDETTQLTTTTNAELTDTELDHVTGAGTDLATSMTGDDGSTIVHDQTQHTLGTHTLGMHTLGT